MMLRHHLATAPDPNHADDYEPSAWPREKFRTLNRTLASVSSMSLGPSEKIQEAWSYAVTYFN
jgi:hypothetical protein